MPISILITKDTFLKNREVQSTEIEDPKDKIFLTKGSSIDVNWYYLTGNNHYYVELSSPLNGRYNWYIFRNHIDESSLLTIVNPKVVNLDVPYLSQRDNTIRPHQTCNVTCCAMVIKYFYPYTFSETQLEDVLTKYATDTWGRDSIYYHDKLVKILQKYGVNSTFSTKTPFNSIFEHLDNGKPVIYSGRFTKSGHIIVIKGYDSQHEQFIVNDPWGEYFSSGYYQHISNGHNLRYSYKLIERVSYSGPGFGWAHLCSKSV